MSEIRFKATRRLHDSGFKELIKTGDLECDKDFGNDVVYVRIIAPTTIKIDCTKEGQYRLLVNKDDVEIDQSYEQLKEKL